MTTQSCTQCRQEFEISDDDLKFYDKVSPVFNGKKELISPPTICPKCRWQRRLCFRNERNLYHRKCDLSGRSMISMHPADTPFPVYHITEWMSDRWDPFDYGVDFDFNRSFNEQFQELCNRVPHFSAFIDPTMDTNSEYTNCSSEAKNCYMISQAEKNEDCYYSRGINTCKDCCDCLRVLGCELCYESINLRRCYNCLYCQDCDNSSNCMFSSELRGCKNCFGCHGLTQKQYYIFNQPVSKEEWEEKVGKLVLSSAVIEDMKRRSADMRLQTPQRAVHIIQSENCSGDDLLECRNAKQCFDCSKLEDCAYCYELASGAKDSYDFSMYGLNCELVYECSGGGYGMHSVRFLNHCWNNVSNLLYCESCFPAVKDCFGCFGLRSAQHCIFNKQYTEDDYEKLVPKIIAHMRKTKEFGEFFDPKISAYGYNESLAAEFFPLSKKEIQSRGWRWYDEQQTKESYLGPEIAAPATIADVSDDITEKILRCEKTRKPYRITSQELKFYRQLGIPLPRICPQQRHLDRITQRRPRTLWERKCDNCSKEIESTCTPERPEKIFCDECYLQAVA